MSTLSKLFGVEPKQTVDENAPHIELGATYDEAVKRYGHVNQRPLKLASDNIMLDDGVRSILAKTDMHRKFSYTVGTHRWGLPVTLSFDINEDARVIEATWMYLGLDGMALPPSAISHLEQEYEQRFGKPEKDIDGADVTWTWRKDDQRVMLNGTVEGEYVTSFFVCETFTGYETAE